MTRRRLAAVLATCSLAMGGMTALAAPAAAISDVSIDGPATAGYYTLADVQGTAEALSTVQLYVERAGDSSFSPGQTAQVDASGQYEFQLRIMRTSTYYVQDGSEQSSTITTRQYTASCSVGGAQLTHLPLGRSRYSSPYTQDFASFTASRGQTFAGVAGRDSHLAVIVRRPGESVKVLHTFDYSRVQYSPAGDSSLDVAGVTPSGAVVASAQDTGTNLGSDRSTSYLWRSGRMYTLGGPSSWVSTRVTGVSDEGYIAGSARVHVPNGSPVYRVVIWNDVGDVVFERSTGTVPPSPVLDGNDDLAFTNRDDYAQALTMAGDEHELRAYPLDVDRSSSQGVVDTTGASLNGIYATVQQGIMQWIVPQSGGTDPIVGTTVGEVDTVFAADDAGDLLVGGQTPSHLHTAAGAVATLPAQPTVDVGRKDPGSTIASSGAVSFTSSEDDLPHLLHCSTVET